jgi:hypothetical protein
MGIEMPAGSHKNKVHVPTTHHQALPAADARQCRWQSRVRHRQPPMLYLFPTMNPSLRHSLSHPCAVSLLKRPSPLSRLLSCRMLLSPYPCLVMRQTSK